MLQNPRFFGVWGIFFDKMMSLSETLIRFYFSVKLLSNGGLLFLIKLPLGARLISDSNFRDIFSGISVFLLKEIFLKQAPRYMGGKGSIWG